MSVHKPLPDLTIDPTRTAFFLDVDGTLLGFRDRPEDVVADAELLDLLACLRTAADGAVALVSGRRVDDLDRIMSPLVLPAGGVHGADLRYPDGRRERYEGEALAEIEAATREFVGAHPGLRLEEKGGSTFAVHFRQVPDLEPAVLRFLGEAVAGTGLTIQPGKMVAEVKPAGCDKGRAILRLAETAPFAERIPLFIGDDLTDEHGFVAVNRAGGMSFKVGTPDEPSEATHRLDDPASVRAFLGAICR